MLMVFAIWQVMSGNGLAIGMIVRITQTPLAKTHSGQARASIESCVAGHGAATLSACVAPTAAGTPPIVRTTILGFGVLYRFCKKSQNLHCRNLQMKTMQACP